VKSLIEESVLQKYNFNLVAAVTDNAANMIATCRLLQVPHIPCSAHTIQLVVNSAILKSKSKSSQLEPQLADITKIFTDNEDENRDIMSKSEEVSVYMILKRCKRLVGFFHSSSKKMEMLREELRLRGIQKTTLIQSVYTRWNSLVEMWSGVDGCWWFQEEASWTALLLPPFEKIWRRIWGGWSVS
jgi:hypothetical protein